MSTIEVTNVVKCDLSEDEKYLEVRFDYDQNLVRRIKDMVPGRRFVPPERGGPAWRCP